MAKLEIHMHSISPTLIRTYREAKFVVEDIKPITFKVGECNLNLAALLKKHKVFTAAFITAFNPYSNVLSVEENLKSQGHLLEDISRLGLETVVGYGQDVAREWPKETSLLVLGITEAQAETLADRHSQNGFIWIGSGDALPMLRLRHPIAVPTNSEIINWISCLPTNVSATAKLLSPLEQAWLMSTPESEQLHWLDPNSWDLNRVWPLAKPDGSAMGIGTELDRIFKLIAAGQSQIIRT